MRIIDADELVRQMKTYSNSTEVLSLQMATKNLIGIIESQSTVTDYKAKEERIAELEKKLEAKDLYIKQLQDASKYDNGLINGLQFAVRCNGISPDVTLPFR